MLVKVFKENSEEVIKYLEFNGYRNPETTDEKDIYEIDSIGNYLEDVTIIYSSLDGFSLGAIVYLNRLETNRVDKELIYMLIKNGIKYSTELKIFVKAYCYYKIDKESFYYILDSYKCFTRDASRLPLLIEVFKLVNFGIEASKAVSYALMPNMDWHRYAEIRIGFEEGLSENQILIYALQDINYNVMHEARVGLLTGISATSIVDLIEMCSYNNITNNAKYVKKAMMCNFSSTQMTVLLSLLNYGNYDFEKVFFVVKNGFSNQIPVPSRRDVWIRKDNVDYFNPINGFILFEEKLDEIIELIEMGVNPDNIDDNMKLF